MPPESGFVLALVPGCEYPLMNTASVIAGSAEAGAMVCTPEPEMLNAIVSSPGSPAVHSPAAAPEAVFVLAAMIASRNVHTPSLAAASVVLLTVIVLARANAGARSIAVQAMAQAKAKPESWNRFVSAVRRRPFMRSPVVAAFSQ